MSSSDEEEDKVDTVEQFWKAKYSEAFDKGDVTFQGTLFSPFDKAFAHGFRRN